MDDCTDVGSSDGTRSVLINKDTKLDRYKGDKDIDEYDQNTM